MRGPTTIAALVACALFPGAVRAQSATASGAPSPTAAAPREPTGPAPTPTPSSGVASAPPVVDAVVIAGSSIPAGRATANFRAPLDVVANVLTDFAHYREFIPQVNESRVIHRRRGQVELYLQVTLLRNMGTLWALSRVQVTRTANEIVLDGALIDGNVHRFDLHLEARTVTGTPFTRVSMTVLGIPARMIPDAMVAPQQARCALHAVLAMQARAESRAGGAPGHVTFEAPMPSAPFVVSQRPER